MNKTYYCTTSEWHYVRSYSFVSVLDSQEERLKGLKGWFLYPLALFVISAIGSNIQMHWLWFSGILLSFPLFLFTYQINNSRNYASLVEKYEFALSNRAIPYITLDENYLQFHFYRPDQSVSQQIKLQEIYGMAMSTLRNSTKTLRLPALINKRARDIGGEIVPEKYEDRQVYQLWIYTKTKVMSRSYITIPTGWLNDDTFAKFIDQLQKNSGVRLDLGSSTAETRILNYLQQHSM